MKTVRLSVCVMGALILAACSDSDQESREAVVDQLDAADEAMAEQEADAELAGSQYERAVECSTTMMAGANIWGALAGTNSESNPDRTAEAQEKMALYREASSDFRARAEELGESPDAVAQDAMAANNAITERNNSMDFRDFARGVLEDADTCARDAMDILG